MLFPRSIRRFPRGGVHLPPPAVLALLYATSIAVGTALLKLPIAVLAPLSWWDAAFTATSAVTVTGLIVVDTGSQFTLLGQAVIMVLIQLGGLGLMTFAVLVLSGLGLPIGMPHRIFLREDLNQTSIADLMILVNVILRVVLVCELVGAVLLAAVFVPDLGWGAGTARRPRAASRSRRSLSCCSPRLPSFGGASGFTRSAAASVMRRS